MNVIAKLTKMMETSSSNPAVDLFLAAKKDKELKEYSKFGRVEAIKALKRQQIDTYIDGKFETTNFANPGDFIVTGVKGEQYVLTADKLKTRYKYIKGTTYEAVGKCYAFKYKGKSFTFDAPWGEAMICNNGDYICSTKLDGTDVYRIEADVFRSTYRLK